MSSSGSASPSWPTGISRFDGHRRAFVKVQDGCILNCTYCIIPQVRPGLRSRTPEEITAEVRRLVDRGYKEIILTGIHLGHYGVDTTRGRSGKRSVPPVAPHPPARPDSRKLAAAAVEPGSGRSGAGFYRRGRRLRAALSPFSSVPAKRFGRRSVPDEAPLPRRTVSRKNRRHSQGAAASPPFRPT